MSFTVDGVTFTPDYKAKEKRLYQIIASRESEIASLQREISAMAGLFARSMDEITAVKEELRALKAKERRRATKRKIGREQPE